MGWRLTLALIVICIGIIFRQGSASAASFDCDLAKSAAEKAICNDTGLSELDEEMAERFQQLRTSMPENERSMLGKKQLAFIGSRDECEDDVACLTRMYNLRVDELCKLGQTKGLPCPKFSQDVSSADKPQLGYCHMDICSWFVISEQRVSASNTTGKLLEFQMRYGQSEHYPVPDKYGDEYPERFSDSIPIAWNDKTTLQYALCSKELPSLLDRENGVWTLQVIDFAGTGVIGANSFIAGLYANVCYGVDPDTVYSSSFVADYGFEPVEKDYSEQQFSNPEEVLNLVEGEQ